MTKNCGHNYCWTTFYDCEKIFFNFQSDVVRNQKLFGALCNFPKILLHKDIDFSDAMDDLIPAVD